MRWVLGVCILLKAQSERQDRSLVAAVLHFDVEDDGSTRESCEVNNPWREPNVPQFLGDPFQHWKSGYGRAAGVDRQKVVPVEYCYQIVEVLVLVTIRRVLQVVTSQVRDVYRGTGPSISQDGLE